MYRLAVLGVFALCSAGLAAAALGWTKISSPSNSHSNELHFSRDELQGVFDDVVWNGRAVASLALTFVISALANAGGLGGGAFLVPLFNFILGVSLKEAMGLSQAAITGGALAAGALALFSAHPLDETKPLLDLEIALLLMPCLLLGVTLGVTLNEIFPDWLLVIIVSVLLVAMSLRTLRSGLRLHRAEVAARQHVNEEGAPQECSLPTNSEIPSMASANSQQIAIASEAALSRTSDSIRFSPRLEHQLHSRQFSTASGSPSLLEQLSSWQSEGLRSFPVDLDGSQTSTPSGSPTSLSDIPVSNSWRNYFEGGKADPSTKQERRVSFADGEEGGKAVKEVAGPHQDQTLATPFEGQSEQYGRESRKKRWAALAQHVVELVLIVLLWGTFLMLQILKSQTDKCSPPYFLFYAGQAGFCVVAALIFAVTWLLMRRDKSTSDDEDPLLQDDGPHSPHTRPRPGKVVFAAAIVGAGGCLCSLCGLGGGMILGPVLLELGLHPLAAAATSLLLVGSSSSAATIQFALGDRLEYGWAVIMFCTCIVASIVGVAGFGRVVRASGRASLIVFLLFAVMGTGGIVTLVFGGIHAVESLMHGGRIGFLNPCALS